VEKRRKSRSLAALGMTCEVGTALRELERVGAREIGHDLGGGVE